METFTSSKQKPKNRRGILIVGIVFVLLLAINIIPRILGSLEPIVGKWHTAAVMNEEGEFAPAYSDGYISIKGNRTFYMCLGDLEIRGTWKQHSSSTDSNEYRKYWLAFEDPSGNPLSMRGVLTFDTYSDKKERVCVIIEDIDGMFVFEK